MRRIRVLVVDDSVVVRRLVSDVISADQRFEVVGTAANGSIGLQKIGQLSPDLVTLDVEMPELDGLQTLVAIREKWPRLPVIMFSTLTERGAATTLEALSRGASDYVTKPANVGSVSLAQERVREQLLPKILAFCGHLLPAPAMAPVPPPKLPSIVAGTAFKTPRMGARREPIEIVAVGVSTGGPNALAELIPALPGDLGVPVVVVQHMPAMFTKLLAERLDKLSPLSVAEGIDGEWLNPGQVWIAPGDRHMLIQRQGDRCKLRLNDGPPENSCRPAVDPLFASVTECYGGRMLAVILTGMGYDGLRGSERVKLAGGRVIAQDEASSVVWGMPGAVARAGLADSVLPLHDIAAEIKQLVGLSTLRFNAFGTSRLEQPLHGNLQR